MEARRLLPILAAVAALGTVAVLGAAVGGGLELAATTSPVVVTDGDRVTVHLRIYDAGARLLFSTAAADTPALERVAASFGSPFVVPPITEDAPTNVVAKRTADPVRLDNTSSLILGNGLLGRGVGERMVAPVLGSFEGYTETVRLERLRGPFPIHLAANASTIEALGNETADGRVLLDDVLPVRVLGTDGGAASIEILLADGDRLPVRQTEFTATVLRDAGAPEFRLHLDAEPGATFSLLKPCEFARYVLPVGSYRVEEVTADEIVLARSPTRWPQLAGRPVVTVLEILAIQDKE